MAPTKARPTIANLWRQYAERIVPTDAPDVQKQETKRTFYTAVWLTLNTLRVEVSELSDDEGVACLEAMHDEYKRFIAAMLRGL